MGRQHLPIFIIVFSSYNEHMINKNSQLKKILFIILTTYLVGSIHSYILILQNYNFNFFYLTIRTIFAVPISVFIIYFFLSIIKKKEITKKLNLPLIITSVKILLFLVVLSTILQFISLLR